MSSYQPLRYYVLAFDGDTYEQVIAPAVSRAFYENDFAAFPRLEGAHPSLRSLVGFARRWFAKGCVRPLKHYSSGICEYNTKSLGQPRLPIPASMGVDEWTAAIEQLGSVGHCTLIDVPCGEGNLIHNDVIELCRLYDEQHQPVELGSPTARDLVYSTPPDEQHETFVDVVASAMRRYALNLALAQGGLRVGAGMLLIANMGPLVATLERLTKLGSVLSSDIELSYTGDKTGYLGYLTAADVVALREGLAAISFGDEAQAYLEALRDLLDDAAARGCGMVLEAL